MIATLKPVQTGKYNYKYFPISRNWIIIVNFTVYKRNEAYKNVNSSNTLFLLCFAESRDICEIKMIRILKSFKKIWDNL